MLLTLSTLASVSLISAEHCTTAPQWVICFNGNPVCCCKSRPHELNSCLAAFVLRTQGPTLGLVWESFDFFIFFGHFRNNERPHASQLSDWELCICDYKCMHFGQSTDKVSGVLGAQILRLCWSEAELGISGGCLTLALSWLEWYGMTNDFLTWPEDMQRLSFLHAEYVAT